MVADGGFPLGALRAAEAPPPTTLPFRAARAWDDRAGLARLLLDDGDARIAPDPATGLNRYGCPAVPPSAGGGIVLSSCTASPPTAAGFARARAALRDIERAAEAGRPGAAVERRWRVAEAEIRGMFVPAGVRCHAVPLASGTDALRVAALLPAAERPDVPVTAVIPQASETGTGVPAAVAAVPEGCAPSDVVEVALRGPDGLPLPAAGVRDAFLAAAAAARRAGRRAVLVVTPGTKTGLVAPDGEVPGGTEAVVDAAQGRVSPAEVGAWLGRGWPVVLTGSKFLGGPAFSGVLLLPWRRWPREAVAEALEAAGLRGGAAFGAPALGVLLRWEAALAVARPALAGGRCAAALAAAHAAGWTVLSDALRAGLVPGARLVPGTAPGASARAPVPRTVWTLALADPRRPGAMLSADGLRPLWWDLATRGGALFGQPVDLGPFGGVRIALGARDLGEGPPEAAAAPAAVAVARGLGALAAAVRGAASGVAPELPTHA